MQVTHEPLPSSRNPPAEAATLGSQLQGQGIPVQPLAPGLTPGLQGQGIAIQPSAPGPAASSPLASHASSDVTVSLEAESTASAHQKHSRQLDLGGKWPRRWSSGRMEASGALIPEVQAAGFVPKSISIHSFIQAVCACMRHQLPPCKYANQLSWTCKADKSLYTICCQVCPWHLLAPGPGKQTGIHCGGNLS